MSQILHLNDSLLLRNTKNKFVGVMLTALIVAEHTAKMLLMSEYMNTTAELRKFRSYIESGLTLEDLSEKEREEVIDYRHDWEAQSMKEWKEFPGKYDLSIQADFNGKPQKCDLCHKALTRRVLHVINKENGNELYIGSTCRENVINHEPALGRTYTQRQSIRKRQFDKNYPEIRAFLARPKLVEDAPYEVSEAVYHSEIELRRTATRLFDLYVIDNKQRHKSLNRLTRQIKALPKRIADDVQDKTDVTGLAISLRQQIEADQTRTAVNRIRSLVRKDKGFLRTDAAKLIKDDRFLAAYATRAAAVKDADMPLKRIAYQQSSGFLATYNYKKTWLTFVYPSETTIAAFGYPLDRVKQQQAKQLLTERGKLADQDSETAAAIMALNRMNSKNLHLYRVRFGDFSDYLELIEARLPENEKTKIDRVKKQLRWHLSKYYIVRKPSESDKKPRKAFDDNNVYSFLKHEEVVDWGVEIFKSTLLKKPRPEPKFTTKYMTRSELFRKIYQEFDSRHIAA